MTPLSKLLRIKKLRAPELVYFDHLYSEYSSLQSKITDAEAKAALDKIVQKRKGETLSWNDLYYFELILADVRPIETLRSKILSLRYDYRSVAGQNEYNEYEAAKPPNLQDPPDPTDPPDAGADYEKLLREDLKDLLDRLYLRYSILPVREAKLKRLTLWAAGLCGVFLLIMLAIVIALVVESAGKGLSLEQIRNMRIPSLALFVVLFAGAMGGFVSVLQRVQTPSNEGDSLYNLSVLFNGSYAVFVAPLTGAIFAVLLYFMFTGKILEGRFFPIIYTPPAQVVAIRSEPSPSPTPASTPTPTPSPTPSASPTPARTRTQQILPPPTPTPQPVAPETSPTTLTSPSASPVPSPSPSPSSTPNPSPTATPLASPSATPRPIATDAVGVKDFLTQSGPAGGDDYALLIIWCFIAGFAERFVPDALNRLVIGKQTDGR